MKTQPHQGRIVCFRIVDNVEHVIAASEVTINCKLVLCTGRQVIQNILPTFNHIAGVELSSLGLYTLEDLLERGLDSEPQQRNKLLETELGHQSKRENVKFS
jgi:hypothetical protein